jgi:hypothetical protein
MRPARANRQSRRRRSIVISCSDPEGGRITKESAIATAEPVVQGVSSPRAAPSAEEPIQSLLDVYKGAERAWEAISSAEEKMQLLAQAQHPKRPESLYGRRQSATAKDGYELFPLTVEQLKANRASTIQVWGPKSKGLAGDDKRLRDFKKWEAACVSVDAAYGLPALKAETSRAWSRLMKLEDRIVKTPARTNLGILLKLKLIDEIEGYTAIAKKGTRSTVPRVVAGLIAELQRSSVEKEVPVQG